MSDLDQVKGLIAQGDKENAVVQLASILLENRNDVEAWLLMGEIIDDPSRKKDCYNWVLRLSPHNVFALMKLQELESRPSVRQIASTKDDQTVTKRSLNKSRQNSNYVPIQNTYPIVNHSKDDPEVISYFIVGIVAVLVILYVLVTGNFSSYGNFFCVGLFFIVASIAVIILSVNNKNRG
jgi:hypothetical protein